MRLRCLWSTELACLTLSSHLSIYIELSIVQAWMYKSAWAADRDVEMGWSHSTSNLMPNIILYTTWRPYPSETEYRPVIIQCMDTVESRMTLEISWGPIRQADRHCKMSA
jgi:hypothetical protein